MYAFTPYIKVLALCEGWRTSHSKFNALEGRRQGLHQRFPAFLKAHGYSPAARGIV
jgi:hypothetical protein